MVKRRNFGGVFKKFIEETSIRGAPRIVTSSSIAWRVIWFFVVTIFLLMTAWSIATMFVHYLEYGKESATFEVFKERVEAPSVTVCNLNPLSDQVRPASVKQPWSEYKQMVDVPGLKKYSNLKGYFETIGRDNASIYGHSYAEFVLHCEMLLVDGNTKEKVKVACADAAAIKTLVTMDYFNCYTLEFDNTNDPEHYLVGYSLIFYVDANGNSLNDKFSMGDDNSKRGVKLALHPSDIMPDLHREGIILPPGYAASVEAKVKETKLLPEPYGMCKDSEDDRLFDLNDNRITYTAAMCEQACAQKVISDKCDCLMPEVMAVKTSDEVSQPYCGAVLPSNRTLMDTRIECMATEKSKISKTCTYECHVGCTETTYPTTTSSARWPPISQHLSFYKSMIKGRSYASNFLIYNTIETELQSGSEAGRRQANDLLMQNNHIYENFLKVNIHVDGSRVQVMEEYVAQDFATIGWKAGALLSVYCGVTLVFFIEIIQLFCSLIGMAICGEDVSVASEHEDRAIDTKRQDSVENEKGAVNGGAIDNPEVRVDSSEAANGEGDEAVVKVED